MTSPAALEARVQAIGRELFERAQGETPGVFSSAYWEGQLLAWAMRDASFKVDLFRFVDAFPMLRTREQVAQHVEEMLLRDGRELPAAIATALRATTSRITGSVAQAALRKNVEAMAQRFIVGRDARDTLPGCGTPASASRSICWAKRRSASRRRRLTSRANAI